MANPLWNSAINLGPYTLKNRIVYPPLSTNWSTKTGEVTDKMIQYYKEQASGGCAMIIVEGTAVSREGRGSSHSLCLCDEKQIPSFSAIVENIRSQGCVASIQLLHAGGQANPKFTGYPSVSPSGVRCEVLDSTPQPLCEEDIRRIIRDFGHTAALAKQAGFQGIELHLAHGYLLHEFLSEHTNRRTDAYGGSIEKRVRIILEIIDTVKENASGLLIGARISGEDYLPDGINAEVNATMLPLLVEAGIQYFHVTAGIYDTGPQKHDAMKRGEFFTYSKKVKHMVTVPIIGVGKVLDLEGAEGYLHNGDCDLVAIGRGLLADPLMVTKVQHGESFNRCIECRKCMYLKYGREYLKCPVRPV